MAGQRAQREAAVATELEAPPPAVTADGGASEGGRLKQAQQRVTARATATQERLTDTTAGAIWGRLNALDVTTHAMTLAALLVIVALPFFITLTALAGQNFSQALARHIGATPQAAQAIRQLFGPAARASSSVTALGFAFLLAGVIGVAASIQQLYEKIFVLENLGMRREAHRLFIWVAVLIGLSAGIGAAARVLGGGWSGSVMVALLSFVGSTAFFWWSMHFLLHGRVAWRELFPSALATGVCWVGLGVFSSFYFSREVVSDQRTYGSIGVIFVLMSWLIAVGVVIALGAVAGAVWVERPRRKRHVEDGAEGSAGE